MNPLIEIEELAALLEGPDPVVLADVRWNLTGPSARPDYEAGHLPGAHWVDLETELAGPPGEGGRHPLPDSGAFTATMRRIGVGPSSLVVAYDAAQSTAAARLWWLLRDAGHERVRVLNGGYAAWLRAGLPVESGPDLPADPPGTFVAHPGHLPVAGADEVSRAQQLIDVRAAERYRGEAEPVDPVAGHIPGAVNLPTTQVLEADGRFRPAPALARHFVDVERRPVVYCGSGITASHTLLALTVAGREDGVLYPGSWSEWIRDPSRPVATG
jgi:thiosulfate/3-mercaptopyruvate sulfurtransferase